MSASTHDGASPGSTTTGGATPPDRSVVEDGTRVTGAGFVLGLLAVLAGGVATRLLTENVPVWAEDTAFADVAGAIEYPVYAILLGLGGNALLSALGVRDRLAGGFRTEFFIKTGLVVLGATVVLSVLVRAAGPAILQGLLLITGVFAFAWWLGGRLGLDDRLRALLASAVSICGVSAAIAAAGAVRARREQLAYTASLVIAFALPSIFLLPWLAGLLGLSDAVTGAWLGGNIDTTAAVTAAGAIAGEDTLQVASVVKLTQNALIGFVAVGLTAWFAFKVDRGAEKPRAIELWHRFPKFVLGFVAASVIATIFVEQADAATVEQFDTVVKGFRDYFLILAFVSIGLEFKVSDVKEAGWKPVGLFAAATVVNVLLALALASVLFRNFTL
ncbi:YeiH family protein [Nocardioides alkalitolerans]|uniref:YeiH family protein n=1 Tax=Nocardioides alkalitolerans TaxID=281714 RepID=UPI0003F8D0AF|nr:putative sulfate exporter family transporter [Nocardioides alkalitolerans]